jgi:hypothetical protein
VDPGHAPAHRRRDLDRGLVGLDLEQWRVLGDDIALAHEDLDDLGLGQSLAQIGQCEGARRHA